MVSASDGSVPAPHGPGAPFEVLFDGDTGAGQSLPDVIQHYYGSDWRLPEPSPDRPYTFVNFVTSRDGRVSFDEPGHLGGGDISRFNQHDRWLMGLLRARADAIIVGDTTLKLESEHIWTVEYIFPDDAATWSALRDDEGRQAVPLHVFLSMSGEIPNDAAVFSRPEIPVLIATTEDGARAARERLGHAPNVEIRAYGQDAVDLPALSRELVTERRVSSLLCEGGAHVYGAMLAAQQIDDEFLTLSPIIVGNRPRHENRPRPSLVEGVAFDPAHPPASRLLSVRRVENHLFLRSRML